MGCVCECYKGGIVVMHVDFCNYDLKKGDLFVLSWARVRQVRQEVTLQSC